jgi:hypothetical protein
MTKSTPKTKFKDIPVGSIFLGPDDIPHLKIANLFNGKILIANNICLVTHRAHIAVEDYIIIPCKAQLEFEEAKSNT